MSSLKKYNNSTLASSNMVDARRSELERLERQRLDINRQLERLMKRYSKLTGDRKPGIRRAAIGYAPNDWKPSINASGVKRPMKTWVKVAIAVGVATVIAFMIHVGLVLNGIDLVETIKNLMDKIFVSAH